jgi:hypothetical protein
VRLRAVLIACAAAFLAAPCAFAQSGNPFQALDDCVTREATRLEVSREPADVVAEAAVEKCGVELNAATPEGGMLRSNAAARAALKDSARETALVTVVEIRAARYAPTPKGKKKTR